MIGGMDRPEKNRDSLAAEVFCRAELRRSLENPHPECADLAEPGLEEWTRGLPEEDAEELIDTSGGKPVRWVPGEGWLEGRE